MTLRLDDPGGLTGCHLEDWAAAWAGEMRLPVEQLARREGEQDDSYRLRLIDFLADRCVSFRKAPPR